jgi:hypothetical protein
VHWTVELGAVVATAAAGILYALVIVHQGEPVEPVTWAVCSSVAAATATCALGVFVRRGRRALFAFAAAVDLAWAFLGALSIGVFFVPGAMLAAVAAGRRN